MRVYSYEISAGVRDLDGAAAGVSVQNLFTTGGVADTQNPVVVFVTPPEGTTEAGVNSQIRVRFDKLINPLTVTDLTIQVSDGTSTAIACSINFTNEGRDAVIVPHAPLAESALHTITVDGVEDLAGNTVALHASQFTTSAIPDTTRPVVVRTSPKAPFGQSELPVNMVVTLEMDEPIDPGSANSSNLTLRDEVTLQPVPSSFTVSGDGKVVTLIPDSNLEVNRDYRARLEGLTDLTGNFGTTTVIFFETSSEVDTTSPQLVGISPGDGLADVPTNARIVVEFDEPIQPPLDSITLTGGSGEVDVARLMQEGNRQVRLKLRELLDPNVAYAVQIAGIQDTAGNAFVGTTTATFTTGSGVDLINPLVIATNPADVATEVPTDVVIELQFSERASPLIDGSPFKLARFEDRFGSGLDGTYAVAADGLSATFTPSAPLMPLTLYWFRVFGATRDLAGNAMLTNRSTTGGPTDRTFTTGP